MGGTYQIRDNGWRRHGKRALKRAQRRDTRCAATRLATVAVAAAVGTLTLGTCAAYGAGDANEASCPPATESSPGFRSYLPDCRAYELVSAPFTGGASVALAGLLRAGDGEEVTGFDTTGIFAGSENDPFTGAGSEGAFYAFGRTAAGWSPQALDPAAALYPTRTDVAFEAASADLTRSLWGLSMSAVERPARGEDEVQGPSLYVRDAAGGLGLVGPERPEQEESQQRVVGASSDLSHVLVSAEATQIEATAGRREPYWPGDATVAERLSLYEYSYAGAPVAEPQLVGVENEGAPLWKAGAAHVNEGAQLSSQCGTWLGARASEDVYNAISSSGERVFFTAGAGPCELDGEKGTGPAVDELYARVGGEHTVAISEPPLSGAGAVPGRQCTGTCRTDEEDEKDRSAGVFQGASEDGEYVFFLSEQPLVNGAPATAKKLYMERLEGARVAELVNVSGETPGVMGVARVAESGERVYFVAEGALGKANREGHSAVPGRPNLYLYERNATHPGGRTVFVATLNDPADEADWSEKDERPVQASADGAFLAFLSTNHLTPGDASTAAQLFEYDAESETLVRASIGQRGEYPCPTSGKVEEGYNCDGNLSTYAPELLAPHYSETARPTEPLSTLEVANDGTLVFSSQLALTPNAASGYPNSAEPQSSVYEYEAGEVYLISDGEDSNRGLEAGSAVAAIGIDPSGRDVFFRTADALVPQVANSNVNVYDARAGGGFPAQAPPSECAPECQVQASSFSPTPPATSADAGAGELEPGPAGSQAADRRKGGSGRARRARRLARALAVCRSKPRRKRARCETRARKRYGSRPGRRRSRRPGRRRRRR